MKRIYKYTLAQVLFQTVRLPKAAVILSFAVQPDGVRKEIVFWAIIEDNEKDTVPLDIIMIQTGDKVEQDDLIYRATVQVDWWVGHIFTKPHPFIN